MPTEPMSRYFQAASSERRSRLKYIIGADTQGGRLHADPHQAEVLRLEHQGEQADESEQARAKDAIRPIQMECEVSARIERAKEEENRSERQNEPGNPSRSSHPSRPVTRGSESATSESAR